MNQVGATSQTNQKDCLSMFAEGKPVQPAIAFSCGAAFGCIVSSVTLGAVAAGKKVGLTTAAVITNSIPGLFAMALCGTSYALLYNKYCITPQSADNHIPRGNVPITTESLHLSSTQAIVRQPEGVVPPLTVDDNDVHLSGTEFDPPPYSEVAWPGCSFPTLPPNSEAVA